MFKIKLTIDFTYELETNNTLPLYIYIYICILQISNDNKLELGGRIKGFIPFPRVLVLCEMQSVSSRI